MLGISLMRIGAKGKPFYRLVVKERRSKRDGKYLENVGTYNPMLDPAEVILDHDRIQYWIGVGAQPTDTVKSLIKNNPVQTEEERAAVQAARDEKKAAADQARAEGLQAEAERLEAERVAAQEAAAAESSSAEEASAAEAEAQPEATDATAEATPAADEPAPEAEAAAE
jgi:small subunit ribosomal protein S16